MALTDDERNALVAYRLEKARETMLQVRGVLPLRYWEIIANRLYYAAFYAVSALLISEGIVATMALSRCSDCISSNRGECRKMMASSIAGCSPCA